MKNIKRLSLGLIALGLSASAFANSAVLLPSQHGGFKVGIDALYLRPTNNGLDYATTITFPTNYPLGFERNATIDPSYDWGFYAQVGYLFPCTGNDITLGYTYLNSNNHDSVVAPPAVGGTPTGIISVFPLSDLAETDTTIGEFGSAEGTAAFTLKVIDLEAGQRFTTGAYDMRMFAGLRYAHINQSLETAANPFNLAPVDEVNTTIAGSQKFGSEFRGIGPRIGVDARYCLSSGFGLDANLSTSLLVGTLDSYYDATTITAGTPSLVENFTAKNGSNSHIVPVLEAKLGGDYTYILNPRCKSALVLEAGYQVANYFNASEKRITFFPIGNANNVAFDGPYLGVKYYA